MSADEIFVLVLTVICVAAITAMAIHSRRRRPAADANRDE